MIDKPVKNSKQINMLGFMIDQNLKMNYHISQGRKSLINQLNLRINALRRLVRVSDQTFSINLANALFHSKLLYGIEIWGMCPKYLIAKIQVLQNKAAIIVHGYQSRRLDTITLLKTSIGSTLNI